MSIIETPFVYLAVRWLKGEAKKMKVTMVMLSSVDGKTTQGNNKNVYVWSSKEDQKHFFSINQKNNLIVMGRATYEASKPVIKLEKGKLRIVLTRSPNKYSKSISQRSTGIY